MFFFHYFGFFKIKISLFVPTSQLEHKFGNVIRPFVVDGFEETGNVIVPQTNVHAMNRFQFNVSCFYIHRDSFPQEPSTAAVRRKEK